MKATITFPVTDQIGPDSWNTFTSVIHLRPDMTVEEVYKKLRPHFHNGPINVEIHFTEFEP